MNSKRDAGIDVLKFIGLVGLIAVNANIKVSRLVAKRS